LLGEGKKFETEKRRWSYRDGIYLLGKKAGSWYLEEGNLRLTFLLWTEAREGEVTGVQEHERPGTNREKTLSLCFSRG